MHSDTSVSDEFPFQAPALHSALADGQRSDMDNPQVYIRHKDKGPSSHQKKHFFSKKNLFLTKFVLLAEKKCYPLSFPILGGRDLTRALQSSPFQNPGGVP